MLEGRTPGLELPRALLRSLATAVSLASLLQGSGASLTGNLEGRLGLRIVKITLLVAQVDGHPQLTPLFRQPKTFSLKTRVDSREFFTKSAHRAHRLLEELMANDASPPLGLEHAPHLILHPGGLQAGHQVAHRLSAGGRGLVLLQAPARPHEGPGPIETRRLKKSQRPKPTSHRP